MDTGITTPVKSIKSANRVTSIRRAFSVLALALVLPATLAFEARAQDPTIASITRSLGAAENQTNPNGIKFDVTFSAPLANPAEASSQLFGEEDLFSFLVVGGETRQIIPSLEIISGTDEPTQYRFTYTGFDRAWFSDPDSTTVAMSPAGLVTGSGDGDQSNTVVNGILDDGTSGSRFHIAFPEGASFETYSVGTPALPHIVSITRPASASMYKKLTDDLVFDVRFSEALSPIISIENSASVTLAVNGEPRLSTNKMVPAPTDSGRLYRMTYTNLVGLENVSRTENSVIGFAFIEDRIEGLVFTAAIAPTMISAILPTGDENYQTYTLDPVAPALAATNGVVVTDSGGVTLNDNDPWDIGDTISVTWTFTEPVMGFTEDSLELVNAGGLDVTVANIVLNSDATSVSADVTLTGSRGSATAPMLRIAQTGITDRAGNNPAAAINTFAFPAPYPRIVSILRTGGAAEVRRETTGLSWDVVFNQPLPIDPAQDRSIFIVVVDDDTSRTASYNINLVDLNGDMMTWRMSFPTFGSGDTIDEDVYERKDDNIARLVVDTGFLNDQGRIRLHASEQIQFDPTLPTGSNFQSYTVDRAPPAIESVVVTRGDGGAEVNENDEWAVDEVLAFTWTFTEAVTGFTADDLQFSGAVGDLGVSGFTGGDGDTVFTANLTLEDPRAAATVEVEIAASRIQDAVGNVALDGIETFTLAPEPLRIVAIARAGGADQLTNDPAGLAFDIEFNRAHGLVAADYVHFGFQAGGDAVSGTVDHADVSADPTMLRVTLSTADNFPTGEPGYTVGIMVQPPSGAAPGAIFTTASGNRRLDPALPAAAADNETYTVDNARPTVTIVAPDFEGAAFDVVLNFSEEIMGFDIGGVLAANATVSNLIVSFRIDPVSGRLPSHTVTITPEANNTADIVISMAENAFTDLAGNSNAPATATVAVPPRIASIIRHDDEHTNVDTVTWSVNFSEVVSDVTTADFAVTGVPPVTLTINSVDPLPDNIEYEVEVGGAALADYNGILTLGLAPGFVIIDTNGNPLTDATPIGQNHAYNIDNRRPQVTSITAPDDFRDATPFTITVEFDEPVMDFDDANDITVTRATVAAAEPMGDSPATTWTALVTPTQATGVFGDIVIFVPDSAATDRVGNGNVSSVSENIPYNAPPTVVSIERNDPVSEYINAAVGDVEWRVTFSEDVTGVDVDDFTVTSNSSHMGLDVTDTDFEAVSGRVYDFMLFLDTPFDYNGTLTLALNSSGHGIADTTSNALIGATPTDENQPYTVDTSSPTVTITGAPTQFVDQSFEITITFTEPVVNFASNDITAQNATVGDFAGSGAVYTATVTPAAAAPNARADITINIVGGVAQDRAGNATRPATTVTVPYNEPIITLALTPFSISENGGIARLTATIDPAAATATMITVTLTPTSPATTAHYNITSTTLTILAGATDSNELQITPVNDDVTNNNRVISISATVVAGGGAVTFADSVTLPLTLTITDEDMDETPPRLVSLERMTPPDERTNEDALVWLATFNEPVSNVNVADFEVVLPDGASGPVTTATVTGVLGVTNSVGTEYQITVSGGNLASYDGGVGLAIVDGHDIEDKSVNPGVNALVERDPSVTNEFYSVDNTAPTVTSITAPDRYTDTAFDITVVFNEEVAGFTDDGITISDNATVSAVEATGGAPADTWTATVTPTNVAAPDAREAITITIALGAANDRAGNASAAAGETETVAYEEPMITLILDPASIQENGGAGGGAAVSATIDPVAATDTIITVTLAPQGGAMASDYMFPDTTLTISAGMAESDSLTITPVDNGGNNVNRMINITATATGGAVTFANDPALPLTLTIVDDDMDEIAPRLASIARMTPSDEDTNADSLLWLVTFNEGVTGVDEAEFSVTGVPQITLVHEVTPVTDSTYEVEVTDIDNSNLADYDGTLTLALVASPNIEDLSVNPSANVLTDVTPTGENQTYTVDNTAPTVTSIDAPSEFVDTPFQVTITFSEPVRNFNINAITVGNATRSSLTGSGDTYMVTITPETAAPNDRQDITITIEATAAQDLAGNNSMEFGETETVAYNEPMLTLTLTPTSIQENGGSGGAAMLSATIDSVAATDTMIVVTLEPQGDAMASDYEFPNAVLTIPANMTASNMLPITAVDNDDNNLSRVIHITAVAAGGAVTFANDPPLPLSLTIVNDEMDTTAPRLVQIEHLTPLHSPTNADTLTWLVTFDEGVMGVDDADFSVTGNPPVTLTSPTVTPRADARRYEVSVTGAALADYNGTLTLVLASSGHEITDQSVNPGVNALTDSTPRTGVNEPYVVDNTAPAISTIARRVPSSGTLTNADTLGWRVTFSEAVTVDNADFSITFTNPDDSAHTPATAPTVTVAMGADATIWDLTATGGDLAAFNGAVAPAVASGHDIEDEAGNMLTSTAPGSAAESWTLDNAPPTAMIDVPTTYNPAFAVTITFNEAVTEFDDVADVTATNATVSALMSDSDTVYTVMVMPDDSENEIVVTLAAGAATDLAGNMNTEQMSTASTFEPTMVTLALNDDSISENGGMATVTATIAPAATVDTTITVSAAAVDPAVAGDFTLSNPAVLTIAMGATESTGTVTITAVDNTADSNDKEVMVTATVTGATTAAPAPLTLTIEDDDLPTVSVTADTSAVAEGTASADVFTITRAVATSESVAVQYTIIERGETSGTQTATIAADMASVMVAVDLSNDTFDGATTVGITLVADAATYNLGATTTATRPITDNDLQRIEMIAVTPDPVVEGAEIIVTLTRANLAFSGLAAALGGVMVEVVVGTQTAQSLTVAFAANSATGSSTFTIPDNSVVETNYQVTATVQTNAAYAIVSGLAPASVAVTDNDDRFDFAGAPAIMSLERHNPTSERTNADSLTWRVMFNEHVTGVGANDFTVTGLTGATVSVTVDGAALAADALTRSVDVTVTGGGLANLNGAVSLQLATDAMIRDGEDEADLVPTAALPATAQSYTVDNTAPTISTIARRVPSSGTRTNVDTLGWRVTFNEAVTVDNDDFSLTFTNPDDSAHTPATAPTVTAAMGADATIWELTATGGDLADFDGTVVAAVAMGHGIADTASNALTNTTPGSDAESWSVDNAAPTLTAIAAPDAGSNNEVGTGAEIAIDFTFDAGDLDVASLSPTISPAAGGSFTTALTQDSTDPMKYTGTFTAGSEPGTVTITLTGYRDDVGNQGTATQTLTLTIVDVPTPTLSADQRYVVNNGVIPVTITFDQDVTGFDAASDISVTGGTATAPTMVGGSASEYTTMITSTANPTTVRVAADVAMSAATGEDNVASNELEFAREPSTNTPTHKVGVPRLDSVTIPSDKDRSREILNQNDTLEFMLAFDEAVLITSVNCEDFAPPTGFECTRVQAVVGATLAQSDSDYATQFDLTYTLTGEANRAIQDVAVVLSSTRTITDQTGESLTGTQASGDSDEHEEIAVDTSALAMTLMDVAADGLAVSLVSEGALSPPSDTVEVRFGESATYDPNAAGALELEGATLESADETRAGFVWTLTLRLDPGVMEVTVTIPANQAMDTRGDMNEEPVEETFAVNQAQSEREMVADFMQRRGAQIMAARPNLFGLLDGSGIGTSSLNLDDGPNRTFAFAGTGSEIAGLFGKTSRGLSLNEADRAAARGDLWMSLKGIRTRTDDAEDDFYSMSVGAHRRLGADRIAGAFIALDQSKTEGRGESRNDSVEGDGWLAGPYLVGRVADRGLYYQVHAAWGQSSNAVRVGEGGENSFDTDRYLVGGALKGDYQLGDWSISPIVSADWFREEQDAYMSGGTRVDDQDITLGEVRAGPQFRRVLRLDSGADLSFKLGLHGVHNLAVDAEGDAPGTFEDGDTRGQVDVDFGYALKGAHLDLGLRYDGIGQDDYESWGADLRLRVTF